MEAFCTEQMTMMALLLNMICHLETKRNEQKIVFSSFSFSIPRFSASPTLLSDRLLKVENFKILASNNRPKARPRRRRNHTSWSSSAGVSIPTI